MDGSGNEETVLRAGEGVKVGVASVLVEVSMMDVVWFLLAPRDDVTCSDKVDEENIAVEIRTEASDEDEGRPVGKGTVAEEKELDDGNRASNDV